MRRLILAHQIEKSDVLDWMIHSYITHVISFKAHVLLLNIGYIGHHVTSSLRVIITMPE